MSKKLISIIIYIILFISILLGLYRIFPYFSLNIPFWYDPGIYKFMISDYIDNLPNVSFSNLSEYTKSWLEPMLWFLWNILHIIGFNIDNTLSFWLWFFSIITSIFIYINLKKYWRITAIIWIIIFLISIIEYQVFWWNYYKQIIGIIFMLTAFHLMEKKKYLLSIPIIISLFTIHKPSWVYFLITFIIYRVINFFLSSNKNTKEIWIVLIAWIISLIMYLPLFKEQILGLLEPLFTTVLTEWKSGTFFVKEDFWKYNILIIFASLYWLHQKIQKKDFDIISCWYIAWMIWVWFGLFFYNRFYIFFDIFIILMAAYWFWLLYKKNKRIFIILFTLFFITQSIFYYNYLNSHNTPLIDKEEFENIKKIHTIVSKDSMLMVTHKHYSPWIAWYTSKPTIAPGLFGYSIWDLTRWKAWWKWDWKQKCLMIKDYTNKYPNKDIYIWVWKIQPRENFQSWECFEETSIQWKWYQLLKLITK